MKNSFPLWAKSSLFIFIAVFTLFSACRSSTSHDDEHEHEPIGLRVYSINSLGEKDQLVAEQTLEDVSGSISITSETTQYTIFFIADDGDKFIPDLSEHTIDVEATENTDNLLITRPTEVNDNTNFGLQGVQGTSAKISIILKHQGSKEFVSKSLPVVINL